MTETFKTFSFHAAGLLSETEMGAPLGLETAIVATPAVPGARRGGTPLPDAPDRPPVAERHRSDEVAARYLAAHLLGAAGDPDPKPILAPGEPAVVPGLAMTRTEESPATGTRTVNFEPCMRRVPVFGTNAVFEIDAVTRNLVSFDASLAVAPDISGVALLSPTAALEALGGHIGVPAEALAEVEPPALRFFADEESADWHLAYHFLSVPVAPPEILASLGEGHGDFHGLGAPPRDSDLRYDYLVDAHAGTIVYYYSAQPRLDPPVFCSGTDEFGTRREFYGRMSHGGIEMVDPLRNIETFDHGLNDITASAPTTAIGHAAPDFGTATTAGVSAHYNATLVFDFVNAVLKRNGINDIDGMGIRSVVNCTYSAHHRPPDWPNAMWWRGQIWYEQTSSPGGTDSYARFLDIIAHKPSHRVTEHSSALVYRDEPGALNESFSDIFGVMVANWYPGEPQPLAGWSWDVGSGLGPGGLPLRDVSDPPRTGHPDHWSGRKHIGTPVDDGGVHYNNGIHNEAAFALSQATDGAGAPAMSTEEVGLFYYLTLTMLPRRAWFVAVRRALKVVASTCFRGDPARTVTALATIDQAYDAVCIR
ncbi:MAG: M4 family metallopeptidase [Pseudomonadota bacterium]